MRDGVTLDVIPFYLDTLDGLVSRGAVFGCVDAMVALDAMRRWWIEEN